jgi:hypothetical protein
MKNPKNNISEESDRPASHKRKRGRFVGKLPHDLPCNSRDFLAPIENGQAIQEFVTPRYRAGSGLA